MAGEFCLKMPDFHVTFRDLLRAVNLRHGTNGFTSLPKEGVLRIFLPWIVRRLRLGLNPRTWVPKASTLSLDHRSCYEYLIVQSQEYEYLKPLYIIIAPTKYTQIHWKCLYALWPGAFCQVCGHPQGDKVWGTNTFKVKLLKYQPIPTHIKWKL